MPIVSFHADTAIATSTSKRGSTDNVSTIAFHFNQLGPGCTRVKSYGMILHFHELIHLE